jgi:hypothetical protein
MALPTISPALWGPSCRLSALRVCEAAWAFSSWGVHAAGLLLAATPVRLRGGPRLGELSGGKWIGCLPRSRPGCFRSRRLGLFRRPPSLVQSALSGVQPRRFGALAYDCYLVDSASSHMLVSKIKPCMSKYKQLYRETANGSLNQLSFIW